MGSNAGIYMIQSISMPCRIYIGSSVNLSHRKETHFNDLINNKHHSLKLQNHYNKYGKDDLVFDIIEADDYFDKNHLLSREQVWMNRYSLGGNIPFFNICLIAGNSMGFKWSESSKCKMRKPKSEKHRRNLSIAKTGRKIKPFSKEHKDKIGKANKGKKRSDDVIRYWKDNVRSKIIYSEEALAKRSASLTGKKRTKQTIYKLSFSNSKLKPCEVFCILFDYIYDDVYKNRLVAIARKYNTDKQAIYRVVRGKIKWINEIIKNQNGYFGINNH